MLLTRISESTLAISPCGKLLVQAQKQLEVLHRTADSADGAHAADSEQVEGPAPEHPTHRDLARGPALRASCRPFPDKKRSRKCDQDHEDAECHERIPPAQRLRQPVGKKRNDGSADPDPEIRDAHRFAAGLIEPSGKEHLVGKRPAAHVAEGVEEVEEVEHPESGDGAQADESEAGHENAHEHQPARAEPVDDPACDESEDRPDHELAVGVAGSHLSPRPPEVAHHEIVEKRQPVQRKPDDGEKGQEARSHHVDLRTGGRLLSGRGAIGRILGCWLWSLEAGSPT